MSVGVVEKKEFIRWFLKEYQMKRRECVWILNYLISHEELLEKVHFVEEAHYCPRAMIMSVTTSSGIPFRFYKGSIMTADAEKSFHDLRLNTEEDVYIQLNFPEPYKCPQFLSVAETNTYIPNGVDSSSEYSKEAEAIIDHSLRTFEVERIQRAIDEAIDQKDKDRFLELTSLFKEIPLS